MKILERKEMPNWSRKSTCTRCNSILEVEIEDLTVHHDNDPRGGSSWYTFECPVCFCQMSISYADVPDYLRQKVKSAR